MGPALRRRPALRAWHTLRGISTCLPVRGPEIAQKTRAVGAGAHAQRPAVTHYAACSAQHLADQPASPRSATLLPAETALPGLRTASRGQEWPETDTRIGLVARQRNSYCGTVRECGTRPAGKRTIPDFFFQKRSTIRSSHFVRRAPSTGARARHAHRLQPHRSGHDCIL